MKIKMVILVLASIFFLFACSGNEKPQAATSSGDKVATQDTLGVSSEKLAENVQIQSDKELEQRRKEMVEEAMTALKMTKAALEALENKKPQEAYKDLEVALGKLEVVLTRFPDMESVPVDVKMERIQLTTDLETVEATRRTVKRLVKEGKLQAARVILNNLVNEIRIKTYQLPLATYPDAIKAAIKLLDQGKTEAAKEALASVLNTLVVTETSVPIPLINAQLLVKTAQDTLEANEEFALKLLSDAQDQLKLAEALGYGDRDREFKEIDKDIETLRDKIEKKEETGALFDSLKARIRKFKERIS